MSEFKKVSFCLWPRRLAILVPLSETQYDSRILWVGWVWLCSANLTKNHFHGWIAFLDDNLQLLKPNAAVKPRRHDD